MPKNINGYFNENVSLDLLIRSVHNVGNVGDNQCCFNNYLRTSGSSLSDIIGFPASNHSDLKISKLQYLSGSTHQNLRNPSMTVFLKKVLSWAVTQDHVGLIYSFYINPIYKGSALTIMNPSMICLRECLHDEIAGPGAIRGHLDRLGNKKILCVHDDFHLSGHPQKTLFRDLVEKKEECLISWVQDFKDCNYLRDTIVHALCRKFDGRADAAGNRSTVLAEVVFDDDYSLEYLSSVWLKGCFLNPGCPLVKAVCRGDYPVEDSPIFRQKLAFVLKNSVIYPGLASLLLFIGDQKYFKCNWQDGVHMLSAGCPLLEKMIFSQCYDAVSDEIKEKLRCLYGMTNKVNTAGFLQKVTVWAVEGSRDDLFLDCALEAKNKNFLLKNPITFTPIVHALYLQCRLVKLRMVTDFIKVACFRLLTPIFMKSNGYSRTAESLMLGLGVVNDADLNKQWVAEAIERIRLALASNRGTPLHQFIDILFVKHKLSKRVQDSDLQLKYLPLEMEDGLLESLVMYMYNPFALADESLKRHYNVLLEAISPALAKAGGAASKALDVARSAGSSADAQVEQISLLLADQGKLALLIEKRRNRLNTMYFLSKAIFQNECIAASNTAAMVAGEVGRAMGIFMPQLDSLVQQIVEADKNFRFLKSMLDVINSETFDEILFHQKLEKLVRIELLFTAELSAMTPGLSGDSSRVIFDHICLEKKFDVLTYLIDHVPSDKRAKLQQLLFEFLRRSRDDLSDTSSTLLGKIMSDDEYGVEWLRCIQQFIGRVGFSSLCVFTQQMVVNIAEISHAPSEKSNWFFTTLQQGLVESDDESLKLIKSLLLEAIENRNYGLYHYILNWSDEVAHYGSTDLLSKLIEKREYHLIVDLRKRAQLIYAPILHRGKSDAMIRSLINTDVCKEDYSILDRQLMGMVYRPAISSIIENYQPSSSRRTFGWFIRPSKSQLVIDGLASLLEQASFGWSDVVAALNGFEGNLMKESSQLKNLLVTSGLFQDEGHLSAVLSHAKTSSVRSGLSRAKGKSRVAGSDALEQGGGGGSAQPTAGLFSPVVAVACHGGGSSTAATAQPCPGAGQGPGYPVPVTVVPVQATPVAGNDEWRVETAAGYPEVPTASALPLL